MKKNMKVEQMKDNLIGVKIERKNSNIDIISKVMLKKKYIKSLTKQYLKKKRFNYRVAAKNKRGYKILSK